MTIRTWNNSFSTYTTASNWSPVGVPVSGDTAVVNGGTPTVPAGTTIDGVTIQVTPSSSSPAGLTLSSGTALTNTTTVSFNAGSGTTAVLTASGTVDSRGFIDLKGASSLFIVFVNNDPSTGAAGKLANSGAINFVNSSPVVGNGGGSTTQTIQNTGSISVWNPGGGAQSVGFFVPLTGTGTIMVNQNSIAAFRASVAAGQTVQILHGASANTTLQLEQASTFAGTITGFVAGDKLVLTNAATSLNYVSTGTYSGVLNVVNGGLTVASLNLSGAAYTAGEFNLSVSGGTSTITTTHAAGTQRFSLTDTHLGLSTTDQGTPYSGPVAGLENQFIWNSIDPVAISTTAANAFIHGGAGQDAIAVSGGSNVLDGGLGSNFLVGTTAASGGVDTFFLDGRLTGETWSTIVNFHAGDRATIFGFTAASTLPWTASDGAAGFEGVTLHSELNGAGTGVNASLTFTGLTLADQQSHFSTATGTLSDGTPYLIIAYDR